MDRIEPLGTLRTAVLFIVFNRPETTARVFETIRQAKPPRLYVAADGARNEREGEPSKVARVREIATKVDWPCELKTLFRDQNLGCKYACSGAITWFFEHEEQGIILEDDCLPHPDFFSFCENLLDRYVDDVRVWTITGNNFQNGARCGEASYYFSRLVHAWGWAGWRRSWEKNDLELTFWPEWKNSQEWRACWPQYHVRKYWENIFDRKKGNSWAYPWLASALHHGGLTATPNVNLVSNIGFGADATHTKSISSERAGVPTKSIGNLTHPGEVVPNTAADNYMVANRFGARKRLWLRTALRQLRRGIRKQISTSLRRD